MKKVVAILALTVIAIFSCVCTVNAADSSDPTFAISSIINKVYGV